MKVIKKQLLSSLLVFFVFCLNAQKEDKAILLKTIDITAGKIKYMTASKKQKIDSVQLNIMSSENLGLLLSKYTPIYIKQNAVGLSTIHFRGTSANHTAVLFNGININSLTLGHSNIANIPSFLFSDIKIQFGSASALYGTDAIGGSIHLNNNPQWNKGLQIGLQQDFGSFHSYFSGIQFSYSNSRFSYLIKALRSKKKNDFTFTNYQAKDFENNKYIIDTARNSKVLNYGILQTVNYWLNQNLLSHFDFWYEDNWRQIQPNMSANYYGGDNAEILNKNTRIIAGLKYYKKSNKLTIDFGFIHDYQVYNKNQNDIIATKSGLFRINYFNTDIWKGDLNIGLNLRHIKPEVYAYDINLDENRIDAFLSFKKTFFNRIISTVNLRQAYVSDYSGHFSPSLGFKYNLIKHKNSKTNIKLSYSNSYKIPTLNDRYWLSVGNPDLLAENSNAFELSGLYSHKSKINTFDISLTGFYLIVDNWIQWINQGNWKPVNKKKVLSNGIEMSAKYQKKINKLRFSANLNFTLNSVKEVENYTGAKPDNSQLIYSPKMMGTANFTLTSNHWTWQNSVNYAGKRLTETGKVLNHYLLLDVFIERKIKLEKHIFSIAFSVNNLLNTEYQNWEYYAMPGRNYKFSIKYNLNK